MSDDLGRPEVAETWNTPAASGAGLPCSPSPSGHGWGDVPREGAPIVTPPVALLTSIVAVPVLTVLLCLVMGARWNRLHGYRLTEDPRNDDDVWWMAPERTHAAHRRIRHGDTAHDPATARDVCVRARARLILLRNPWYPVAFAVLHALNTLYLGRSVLRITEADRDLGLLSLTALILGVSAAAGVVAARWRARAVRRARDAFLAHRDIAGETRELPLPDERTP